MNNTTTLVSKISECLKDDHGLLHKFCNDVITINMTLPSADKIMSTVTVYQKYGQIIFDIKNIEDFNWSVYKGQENLIFTLLHSYFKSTDYTIKYTQNNGNDVCFGIERTVTSFNKDAERFHELVAAELLVFIEQVNSISTKITDLCASFCIRNK